MEFKEIDRAVVCRIPADSEIAMEEALRITAQTSNTWQKDREEAEKTVDTIMGKTAEIVIEAFFKQYCQLVYLSYDKFRADEFEKHAPFDGLLYSPETDRQVVASFIQRINDEIAKGAKFGKITPGLRREMEFNGIFTIEVKSSNLKKHDFDHISQQIPRTGLDRQQIIKNIERWDFFIYPHFLRTTETIETFYEYAEYVRKRIPEYGGLGNRAALSALMRTEYENASDIYTRLYFDRAANEIYIPGYIWKKDFFRCPVIKRMHGDKSERALYYMYSIANRKSFWEIDQDFSTWKSEFPDGWRDVFACGRVQCPKCGKAMDICGSPQRKAYYYKCFPCKYTQSIRESFR